MLTQQRTFGGSPPHDPPHQTSESILKFEGPPPRGGGPSNFGDVQWCRWRFGPSTPSWACRLPLCLMSRVGRSCSRSRSRSTSHSSGSTDSESCSQSATGSNSSSSCHDSSDSSGGSACDRRVRTSGSSRGLFWEVCCHPSSLLCQATEGLGMRARRLTLETGYDFREASAARQMLREAQLERPDRLWLALPCTPWSTMQNANQRTPRQRVELQSKRAESMVMLQHCLRTCLCVVKQGGEVYFEWPTQCHGWGLPQLKDFEEACELERRPLCRVRLDGCMFGLRSVVAPHRLLWKRWTVLTTDQKMMRQWQVRYLCNGEHNHAIIQGRDTARSAYYPPSMAFAIAAFWVGT